jgi:malonyl CoA-acyl carrier protein transacylase
MLADLSATYPIVKRTFEEASDVLDYDLWKLSQDGPEEALNQTDKTQPARALLCGASGENKVALILPLWQDIVLVNIVR